MPLQILFHPLFGTETGLFFEGPVEGSFGIEAAIEGNAEQCLLLLLAGLEHFNNGLDAVAVYKIVEIQIKTLVDYFADNRGIGRQFFGKLIIKLIIFQWLLGIEYVNRN